MSTKFIDNLCNTQKFNSMKMTNFQEKVFSLNHSMFDENLVKNAKAIIVGTLTPENGMISGYYYTSPANRVYKIIDSACNHDNTLVNLKKQLKLQSGNQEIVNKIKLNLAKNKLAFIDVVDEAIRKRGSSKDSGIFAYTIDFESFKHCNKNQIFICTSNNAADCLNIIADKIGLCKKNIIVCHQDRFHYPADKQLWAENLTRK